MTARVLPIFPLKTVLFPNQVLPLHIFEDRYKQMLEDCLKGEQLLGIVLIFSGEENSEAAVPHPIGTVGRIDEWEHTDKDRYQIKIFGLQRFRIIEFLDSDKPYLTAAVDYWPEEPSDTLRTAGLTSDLRKLYSDYLSLIVLLSEVALPAAKFRLSMNPTEASYHIAANLEVDLNEKQRLLEEPSALDRLEHEHLLVKRERGFLQRLVGLQGILSSESPGWQWGHGIPDRPT
jgi:Lon protease-like protein